MITKKFQFRVDSIELHSVDANMSISTAFSKSDVNAEITQRLKALNLISDENSFNYFIQENQLYVEGWAYEDLKPTNILAIFPNDY